MYRNYYSMNDMPQLEVKKEHNLHNEQPKQKENSADFLNVLKNIEADDTVLLVVMLILLIDECDDKLLLFVLGMLLFLRDE